MDKNMPKFNEYVKQLKEKYSVHDAARTLKMHYILCCHVKKPHGQALSQCAKKNVIKCYLGNKYHSNFPTRGIRNCISYTPP